MKKLRIPENVKKIPRCPLCYATFDLKVIQTRVNDWWICATCNKTTLAGKDDPAKECKVCGKDRQFHHADGKAFFCHFDKVAIMANDPMVGRWEELLAQAKANDPDLKCPNFKCQYEGIRMFATATGYVQFKCPRKDCQSKIESVNTDRQDGDVRLLNQQGEEVALPGIDRAVATPENPSDAQVGGSGGDPALPGVTHIPLPKEGHA